MYCNCGCGQEPQRKESHYCIGHHKRKLVDASDYEIDTTTGCWNWVKALNIKGYGITRRMGMKFAHRIYYVAFVGPIPDGLQLDHLCRNRRCVNPKHLEPVTPSQNSQRGMMAKLNWDDIRRIRRLYANNELNQYQIARAFEVTRSAITSILKNKTWYDPAYAPTPKRVERKYGDVIQMPSRTA